MSAEAVDRRSEPRRHQRAFAGTVRSGPVRSTSEGPSTRCGSADVEGLETSGRHHFQAVDFEGGVKFSAQTRWARSKNRTIISNGSAEAGQTRPFQPSTGGGRRSSRKTSVSATMNGSVFERAKTIRRGRATGRREVGRRKE